MENTSTRGNIASAFLAGVCIAIAGTIYLKLGGVTGAVLFAFGLLAVVAWQLNLFTGKSQFVWGRALPQYGRLLNMLLWNFVGRMAVAAVVSNPVLTDSAEAIIATRLSQGAVRCFFLSIGCGFIMTTAVRSANIDKNWWPLLFGVPVFIICGFPHCVADAFYLCSISPDFMANSLPGIVPYYAAIVTGNYLGCNLFRLKDI